MHGTKLTSWVLLKRTNSSSMYVYEVVTSSSSVPWTFEEAKVKMGSHPRDTGTKYYLVQIVGTWEYKEPVATKTWVFEEV